MLGDNLAILAALGNAFIVIVLTLYFLASLDTVKHSLCRLAPASRREYVKAREVATRTSTGSAGASRVPSWWPCAPASRR